MHPTLENLSNKIANELPRLAKVPFKNRHGKYFLNLNKLEGDDIIDESCKESLTFYMFMYHRQIEQFEVFFCFDVPFEVLKPIMLETFKLFTNETPCHFYKVDEETTVLRINRNSFFGQNSPLVDIFTIVSRMVATNKRSYESKEELLNGLKLFKWNNRYNYSCQLTSQIILKFDEFLELMKNPDVAYYLKVANGLVTANSYYKSDELMGRDDEGSCKFDLKIPRVQALIDFAQS